MVDDERIKSFEGMAASHERALFGHWDNAGQRYVPGLLQRIDEMVNDTTRIKIDIGLAKKDIDEVKTTIQDFPQIVQLSKQIRRWVGYGAGSIIVLLLALVFHQYGLVAEILKALALPK